MKSLLRLLLKTQHQQNRSGQAQTEKGMTLVELLVGAIMAFLIITPMLGFVVDMLNTDRREQVKANTEQDIQAAVDFIAQDLNQAIYIYDNGTINNAAADGTPGIRNQLPNPTGGTPILVFWKRQQVKNAVSVETNPANRVLPINCTTTTCNDTYVRSLVAYYLVRDNTPSIWCQPSGTNCPSRIERYEIREGVRNPDSTTPATFYYNNAQVKPGQEVSPAFNSNFNFSEPRRNVTTTAGFADPSFTGQNPQVLVNYIDHTQKGLSPNECVTALGNPTVTLPGAVAPTPVGENTLKVTDDPQTNTNSFYACVDTSKNLARVTIRGNSLRRLQDSNVPSSADNTAYFPTASVQVQGRGALGK
ncbi:hormogonium polysaccharide secretion pseudopilin HpsC [Microcoleus sp. herbarium5]|uniref:hormogonium polysaccharide secretion pseudopilin HpsC n=1 Tax=Microcoleus sp. herbarium5 TaxID=3055434 RepID=UPI002FD3E4F9